MPPKQKHGRRRERRSRAENGRYARVDEPETPVAAAEAPKKRWRARWRATARDAHEREEAAVDDSRALERYMRACKRRRDDAEPCEPGGLAAKRARFLRYYRRCCADPVLAERMRASKRRAYARVLADPQRLARLRARRAQARESVRNDPAKLARHRERQRDYERRRSTRDRSAYSARYRESVRNDPVRLARLRERQRGQRARARHR